MENKMKFDITDNSVTVYFFGDGSDGGIFVFV